MRRSTPKVLMEMKMAHIYEKTDLGYIIWSHLRLVEGNMEGS